MTYQIDIRQVPAQPIAAIRDRAKIAELPVKVPKHCGTVWNFIRKSGIKSSGNMIAVYYDEPDKSTFQAHGMPIEVGALVNEPFPSSEPVVCSQTPAGTVATTIHIGPYQRLGDAHEAVHDWCKQNNRTTAGISWELYDHPSDDVTKLRTDVFYLLR